MNKEKDSLLFPILFWPMEFMNNSVEKIHAEMDKADPEDPYLEEAKRGVGMGAALSGCVMTIIWLAFLLVVFIVSIILLVYYLI